MTMAQASTVRSVSDLDTVVDCDVHLTERQEDLIPYLEDPFGKMLSRSGGEDYGYLSNLYPTPGLLTPVTTGKVQSDSVRSPDDVKRGMEMLDTDRVVLTPTQNLYLACVHHDDLAAALATAYNEYLLEQYLDPDAGLYGAVVVAPQKPQRAAEEIEEHADESGIIAAFVPSGGVHPPLGDSQYDPIYEASESAGLPLMMHNAAGTMMKNFPNQFNGLDRYLSAHVPAHAMQHMVNLASMVTRGVPVRYPDLEFVVQEAGIGWIPYFERRFDAEYSGKREDAPMLEKPPSEYIRDQFYFTSQPVEGSSNPNYVQQTVRMFEGENCLMFSSDYPHNDFDSSDELFNLLRSEFDADELANIYGQTAQGVFDF